MAFKNNGTCEECKCSWCFPGHPSLYKDYWCYYTFLLLGHLETCCLTVCLTELYTGIP